MQLEYVLNELSMSPLFADRDDANRAMDVFIEVAKASSGIGVKPNIRTHVRINQIELSPGYYISNWAVDKTIDRDKRNYVFKLLTSNPLIGDLPGQIQEDIKETSVKVYNLTGAGITVSYLTNNPVISFSSDAKWDVPILEVEVEQLKTNDQGGYEVHTENGELINFSTLVSLEANKDQIKDLYSKRFSTIEDFWRRKSEVYPRLVFSPEVKDQLSVYSPQQQFFLQAMMRLAEINKFCETWVDGACNIQDAIPNISPESQSTMEAHGELRKFSDDEGNYRLCELHARFTPGPGRIHFCSIPDQKKIFIGYVGLKLKCS